MKSHHLCQTFIGLTVGFLLINSIYSPSAVAGRYVLNQTPQTIERYFGRYITNKPIAIPLPIPMLHKALDGYFLSLLKAISLSSL
ncbi:MAG: hypothetical protein V7L05_11200 [Nostoc sp.]|uniref:hypothetical protein n=1 Tax=Nostoc sp. TaxID=1180 RepID=UPI002FF5F98A